MNKTKILEREYREIFAKEKHTEKDLQRSKQILKLLGYENY